MAKNELFQKLQTIADDFTCGDWRSPTVLSPQRYTEKVDGDFVRQPGPITEVRRQQAAGKWALVFKGRAALNSRTGAGGAPLEATASFTPEEVRTLSPRDIWNVLIGVIAELEFHEVLEWAQLKSAPGEPIVNPHKRSSDLETIVNRVAEELLKHAAV